MSGIDWAKSLESIGGDRNLLLELAEAAMEEYPKDLAKIREAVTARDKDAAKAVHKLKGSLRFFEHIGSAVLLLDLERIAGDGSWEKSPPILEALETQIGRVLDELAHFIQESPRQSP